ncbi:MAG: heme ABC transporter ATP-binding protein, partial [Proteobacteria bacterium]|nr:heme ABC transporter ATP-binding protein [Pseudomonadota bacterium]
SGIGHIPEDRHKYGLILDFRLDANFVLLDYYKEAYQKHGLIKFDAILENSERLIKEFDVRSGKDSASMARTMSGGNQQKAIIAREIDRSPQLLIAAQPTRGLDVGAIEYIHKQIIRQRDSGAGVLLVSLELDEVMALSDRILVMYEGEIVGELDPKKISIQELGLYMAGAKKSYEFKEALNGKVSK